MTFDPECYKKQQDGGWWEDMLADRCSFPIAPINTWTNLAYLVAGAVVMWSQKSWAGAVQAAFLALLGIGSALYHGLKTRFASACDDVGMYLVFSSLMLYAYAPDAAWTPLAMLGAGAILAAIRFKSEAIAEYQHAVLGTATGGVVMADALNGHPLQALGALAILAFAYLVCWKMDEARTFPFPRWGHGIWHILTATGIALLFLAR